MGALRGPDGQIVYVADDQVGHALANGYAAVSPDEAGAQQTAITPENSGSLGGLNAAATGTLYGLTLGLSDVALKGILNRGQGERLATDREQHPVLSGIGQVAGAVLPTLVDPASLLGRSPAGYLSRAAAGGVEAGRATGGALGVAQSLAATGLEGAVQNAGVYLSDTALGDRDLTAEGMAGALGTGFAFGAGGGAIAHGIEAGTIAARRMFARVAEGGDKAAQLAEAEWERKSQEILEANDQTAEIARVKLVGSRTARERAGLLRDQAAASVADARVAAPEVDAARARAASLDDSISKIEAQEKAEARPFGDDTAALQRLVDRGPAVIAPMSVTDEAKLAQSVEEYAVTKKEFDAVHAQVERKQAVQDWIKGVRSKESGYYERAPLGEGNAGLPRGRESLFRGTDAERDATDAAMLDKYAGSRTLKQHIADADHKITMPEGTTTQDIEDIDALQARERATVRGRRSLGEIASGSPTGNSFDSARMAETTTGPSRAMRVADDEFSVLQKKYAGLLTPGERDAIDTYSGSVYKDINKGLRTGKVTNGREKMLVQIDSALAKAPLPQDTVLYRGLSGEEAKAFGGLEPGDSFVELAYSSTSSSPTVFKRSVNLHIEVPAGFDAAPIPSRIDEKEFLLGRNARYTVTAVENDGAAKTIHVRVEPAQRPTIESMISSDTGRIPEPPPPEFIKVSPGRVPVTEPGQMAIASGRRAAGQQSTLEDRLVEMHDRISGGATLKDLNTERMAHPLSPRQLEIAHDDAIDRAAAATDASLKQQNLREAAAIEDQLKASPPRPGPVEDVAAMAELTTRLEKAAASMVEAVGDAAPPAARDAAALFRGAESAAERKTMARTARAADAAAESPVTLGPDNKPLRVGVDRRPGPSSEAQIAAARTEKLSADAVLARARVTETDARIGAKAAQQTAREARAMAEKQAAERAATAAVAAPNKTGSIGSALGAVGAVVETAAAFGIPGIPKPSDIPVVGPLLGAYLKYKALRATAGRFVGRVPATAEAKAASMAARTKDTIARAVDRSLGLVERNTATIRTGTVAASVRVGNALRRRAVDDGEPDAPKGATNQQLAVVRMREVANAAANPRLILAQVQRETANIVDPDLIDAIERHRVAMYQHLNDTAPKIPPPNPYSRVQWEPSAAMAMQWGRRLEVANDPAAAFEALHQQSLTPEAADTLRAVYPKLFAMAQQRLVDRAGDLVDPVPYRQRLQNSLLFNVPLDSSLDLDAAHILQSVHAASRVAPPGAPASPPVPSTAGSVNLSALYQPGPDRRSQMR